MPALRTRVVFCAWLSSAVFAGAHEVSTTNPGPQTPEELLRAWSFEPGVALPLVLVSWLYWRGLQRLTPGRYAGEALCFALGWVSLAVALVSPLHAWGQALFSAHMVQHEILMLVAAPLIVMGRPLVPMLRALPRGWVLGMTRPWHSIASAFRWLTRPLGAWMFHAVVLWAWHAPALFSWTLRSPLVHALQHLSFFGSALLFWWALLQGPQRQRGYGGAVLYLFTTALHSSLLGVLLTFSRTPWYPPYLLTTAAWNLTPLEDQQLGGLIMWIPAGVVYIIAAIALFTLWLRESEKVAREHEQTAMPVASKTLH